MRSATAHACLPLLGFLLWGCGTPPSEPCACADGHGVTLCDGGDCTSCQCLDFAPPTEDPVPAVTRFVDADASDGDGSETDPWAGPHWETLDRDVATGNVLVIFDAGDTWPEYLAIGRTDARSRITVRGFDVTGSKDKGIYWRSGDDIVIEDNLVHANRGTPSVSLDYTSRSGHRSTSFIVRNNHVWDQAGECIYIGGAEGEDIDAHEVVVIENNLVHDCRVPFSSQEDGINIKDRIGSVTVARNVVFETN